MHFSLGFLLRCLPVLALVVLAACGPRGGPVEATRAEIDDLTRLIRTLGPEVDPEEAARAAEIAYSHSRDLAIAYQITDPPLVHNMKVNAGLRPRGLCWHWAEDMETRLMAEGFETLTIHRAIANADNPFRIEHSTALVSRRGGTIFEGVVLDPWRFGGRLFWSPTLEDTDYEWVPQAVVHADKRRKLIEATGAPREG